MLADMISTYKQGNILKRINSPSDLKSLSKEELSILAKQVREYILEVLSENPGHLASSLGAVELTIALHKVFNAPEDPIVWDVGHQAYVHKVLTGRKDEFVNIRKFGGLSGFPKRSESKYDSFGVGHASTSISAALAMAIADKLQEKDNHHIAVIGDGSMTGGMAFEALNHAGSTDANLLVILNDNGISIDKRVGAMSQYLTMITSSATYNRVKNKVWNLMGGNTSNNKPKSFFKKVSFSVKSMFSGKSNFFEALNIRYFGPVDGHDLNSLIKTLEDLKNIKGPKLLHIITKKGKGLPIAESNPTTYHAPGIFNPLTGEIPEKKTSDEILKFQDVFGETLVELAKENKKIVGITPAMLSGCSMNKLQEVFPERTFDVGIAEEHAVTLSAGFACQGLIPVCNIYSSFMQRAYDQLIHDIALQGLGVVICLDRAGLVGEDCATHHGAFDLAYLNCVPNIIVAAPSDENDLRNMLYTAVNQKSPFVIRYPRGKGYLKDWHNDMKNIEIGKGVKVKDGKEVAILCIGNTIHIAKQVAKELAEKNLDIALFDFKFLKPLDKELAKQALESYDYIITMEDGTINGGFGSSIIEFAVSNNFHKKIERIGIPDEFIEQGSVKELQRLCKMDCESVKEVVLRLKNLSID
jgi:1-deoxy-D-xylulose-5-phosphate synthase